MYLPTFWKLTTEATFYRSYHMVGYLFPVTLLRKFLAFYLVLTLDWFSDLDHLSLTLQLYILMHNPTPKR